MVAKKPKKETPVKKKPTKKVVKKKPAKKTATQNLALRKILKEAIVLITGKQAEDVVDLLDTNKHVNEFIIAKKLDLTINQTRNILYKISNKGLVSSIRKKDKRKGWYTYFWKIETIRALEFLKENFLKKINQLENQIKSRETKRFYVCERCSIELTEENALLHDFSCIECGDILSLKDNIKLLKEMKKNLSKLKKDLEAVEDEVKKETEKIEKKRERERKKIAAKKKSKKKIPVKKKPVSKKKTSPKKKLVKKKIKKKKSSKKKSIKKLISKKKISFRKKSKK